MRPLDINLNNVVENIKLGKVPSKQKKLRQKNKKTNIKNPTVKKCASVSKCFTAIAFYALFRILQVENELLLC